MSTLYIRYPSGGLPETPLSIADGGTNSSTALSNGQVMVSAAGAIVESSADVTTNLTLQPGAPTTTDASGFSVIINAGFPNGNGDSGEIDIITQGVSGTAASAGVIVIQAGNSSDAFPGDVQIKAGDRAAGTGEGGYVTIESGNKSGSADTGHVQIITGGTLIFDFVNGTCKFGNYNVEPSQDNTTASTGSTTLNLGTASGKVLTLAASTTLTLTNPQTGGAYAIKIVQGASSFTVTWPGTVKWANGTAPIISTANGAVDLIHLYYDGTNYLGSFVQNLQ